MRTSAFACIATMLFAVASACNGGPATDPDCQNTDYGSCGTACCRLEFPMPSLTPEVLRDSLMAVLSNGGPDGRYALTTSAVTGQLGFSDKYPTDLYHYLGQAHHTTPFPDGKTVVTGPYRDIVNFLVYSDPTSNATTLRAFSLSEINGALGDGGINYKSILQPVRAIAANHSIALTIVHPDNSCPASTGY